MRKIIMYLSCLLALYMNAVAQNTGTISYFPVVNSECVPISAKQLLLAKMDQVITQNGFGNINRADRFVMLAKCSILEKNITPTTPPRISQRVEVTFILGDVIENKTYTSATFELKGIGTNEAKVWQTVFRSLNLDSPQIEKMFSEAAEKIRLFYTINCKSIMRQAQTLAITGEYDRAIAFLMSVPAIKEECYNQILETVSDIYQKKIDSEGLTLLSKAKNAWVASPDCKGASVAMEYLNAIPIGSKSYMDSDELVNSISAKFAAEKEREWQLKIKQYNDRKSVAEREYNDNLKFRLKEQNQNAEESMRSHQRQMAKIETCRSLAEKWTGNQTQTKVYLNW